MDSSLIKCIKCGHKSNSDSEICTYCGNINTEYFEINKDSASSGKLGEPKAASNGNQAQSEASEEIIELQPETEIVSTKGELQGKSAGNVKEKAQSTRRENKVQMHGVYDKHTSKLINKLISLDTELDDYCSNLIKWRRAGFIDLIDYDLIFDKFFNLSEVNKDLAVLLEEVRHDTKV